MHSAPERFRSRLAILLAVTALLLGVAACSSGSSGAAVVRSSHNAVAGTDVARSASPAIVAKADCFGAAAMVPSHHCPPTKTGELTPIPKRAASDKSQAYGSVTGKKDCFARQPNYAMDICHFGSRTSKVSIALVGNSHAGEWLPAVQRIADEHHWKLTTYLASRCANAYVLQSLGAAHDNATCLQWAHRTTELITAGHYDLVVMTNRVSVPVVGKTIAASQAPYARGYQQVLAAFGKAHLPVVGIRDTPAPGFQMPTCLREHRTNFSACDGTRAKWLPAEPLTTAIDRLHDRHIVEADLTSYLCHPVVCPGAIGGAPVYFDASHMTATFAATLAPYLQPYVLKALG